MKSTDTTREEMWAKQHLSAAHIDYAIWERDKQMLHRMSAISRSCTFVVDVYKLRYAFASTNFVDLLGYDSHKIATLERQGIIWNHAFIRTTLPNWNGCRLSWVSLYTVCPLKKETIIAIFIASGCSMPESNTCASSAANRF